jgi:hypothetical protein
MTRWRRFLVASIGALGLVAGGSVTVGADQGDSILEFESMTPVTGAAVGAVNDRGIRGGGLPWQITSGFGEVDSDGHVDVTVKGLVIPVAPFNGTNPVPAFGVTVSCITPTGIVNVRTTTVPTNTAGDATFDTTVSLPSRCRLPILFVTSPTGAWFAMSNTEDEQ